MRVLSAPQLARTVYPAIDGSKNSLRVDLIN